MNPDQDKTEVSTSSQHQSYWSRQFIGGESERHSANERKYTYDNYEYSDNDTSSISVHWLYRKAFLKRHSLLAVQYAAVQLCVWNEIARSN